jgi:Fe2+ or Zn2+ uptake regulation protein
MHRTAEEIETLLRERVFSVTPQRRAIVRALAARGGHWTAAELVEGLAGDLRSASRATVYSTLALLRELGVLAAVAAPDGELRFDANPEPHQHFVCMRCGRLEDVPTDWFPVAVAPGVTPPFAVERFRVVGEGICASCPPTRPDAPA